MGENEKRDWRTNYNRESHKKAQAKYDRENMRHVGLKFHRKNEADVLAKLDSVPSKMGYIKQLIRDDIARTGWNPPVQERRYTDEEIRRMLGL